MKNRLHTLSSWFWLLSLAILATIYTAWLIYPMEIRELNLTSYISLSKQEILEDYNILLNYLTNPFVGKLDMPHFPSSSDGLKHFQDVKFLFHLAQAVFLVLLMPALSFFCQNIKRKSIFVYENFFVFAALTPILIGLMGLLLGFDTFFTLFHQVLFPGATNWLFDPATDPIILVLPETFFLHCFVIFFVFYEVLIWGIVVLGKHELKVRKMHLN